MMASSPAPMISCFVTALGNLFNTSIAVVKLLSKAIFFNTIPFPNPKILDVVSHPKIACNTSIFLHMSYFFLSAFDVPNSKLAAVFFLFRFQIDTEWRLNIIVIAE